MQCSHSALLATTHSMVVTSDVTKAHKGVLISASETFSQSQQDHGTPRDVPVYSLCLSTGGWARLSWPEWSAMNQNEWL